MTEMSGFYAAGFPAAYFYGHIPENCGNFSCNQSNNVLRLNKDCLQEAKI